MKGSETNQSDKKHEHAPVHEFDSTPKEIVHVSFQDPDNKTGGQGVSLFNVCKEQVKRGHRVYYITLKTLTIDGKDKANSEDFPCEGGKISVHRIEVEDSRSIITPYAGSERDQLNRRKAFIAGVIQYVTGNYKPEKVYIHLRGFCYAPLIAGALGAYNVSSTYNLLLSTRMDITQEKDLFKQKDNIYEMTLAYEIASFYANQKIQVLAPGMVEEVMNIAGHIKNPKIKKQVSAIAKEHQVQLYDFEKAQTQDLHLKDRIFTIAHSIGDEFFNTKPSETIKNRVVAWGRISPEKGFHYLIEAAKQCRTIEFYIFGTQDSTERNRKTYEEQLRKAAEPLSNVTLDFRKGGVRGLELIKLIDSAELIVMPSLYEPFGLVAVEALARRKALITTTTTGGCYIMESNVPAELNLGYLIDHDPKILTEKLVVSIKRFFGLSHDEKEKMSQAAVQRARFFKMSRTVDAIANMYMKK